jgi:ATP synthase protein I
MGGFAEVYGCHPGEFVMSESRFPPAQSASADDADEAAESDFKPLSAEEARLWRSRHPALSPWRIVAWQAVAGGLAALLAWLLSGGVEVAWSVAYGALSVVLPAAVLARGLSRQAGAAGSALVVFFVWELVKIALTVAMLLAAPRLVPHLSWLGLLAGFVVAMKVYWVAMWLHQARRKPVEKI